MAEHEYPWWRTYERIAGIALIAMWVAILGISAATYYIYLQPYVDKLEQAYANVQATGQRAQSLEQQVQNFFNNLGTSATTTKQQ